MKCKHIYLPLAISLVLVLSLMGAAGCPTTDKYNLTTNVSPTGGGSVSPSGGAYDPGVTVTITANANGGYAFDYWSGNASGTSATTTVVMDAHKSVTAHFVPLAQSYTLTTSVSPSGAGSVSPSGGEFDAGSSVSLSATANSGYAFDYWSGSASGTSPTTTITIDADKDVTANFVAVGPAVLFSDDFSDPNSGWDTFSDEEGSAFYEGGWFYIKDNAFGHYSESSYAHQYFTDFVLEVETKLVSGTEDNWQGVSCRSDGMGNCYNFGISADGYYEILKFVNGNRIVLKEPTTSIYINEGRDFVNLMRVECIGSALRLFVNGHLLAEVTDSSFTGGDIGLHADSLGGTQFSEVAFDNLVITEP